MCESHGRAAVFAAFVVALVWVAPGASAQTQTFAGGSLDSLRNLSPTLVFDHLRITGELELEPSDGPVTLFVDDLTITSTGRIADEQSACSWQDSPDLTIRASGTVLIEGSIALSGKGGKVTGQSSTCNKCWGVDGGDLTIEAQEIVVSDFLHVDGGWGSTDRLQVGTQTLTYGCRAGDAGNLTLAALGRLEVADNVSADGGRGGSGNQSDGADGADGTIEWVAPVVEVAEIESNARRGTQQEVPAVEMRLRGFAGPNDDAEHQSSTSVLYVTFAPPTPNDYIEDLFGLRLSQSGRLDLRLEADNPAADLDLYLINESGSAILGESNGSPPNDEVISQSLSAGSYLVAVSWCCGSTAGSGYTLRVGDPPDAPPDIPDPPAGLEVLDLFAAGDGLVTRDSVTGIQWLDLTQTRNLSVDDLAAGAGGWFAAGWRPASSSEVCALLGRYAAAPVPCPSLFGTAIGSDVTSALQYTIGITAVDIIRVGTSDIPSELTAGFFRDGDAANPRVGYAEMKATLGGSQLVVQANAREPDLADDRIGHYLVIPEAGAWPSAVTALALLGALRDRRTLRSRRAA